LDSNNSGSSAWFKLTLTSYPPLVEDLVELLEKFDALSVSMTPATSEPIFGDDSTEDRFWEHTAIAALFNPDIDLDILVACIRNKVGPQNILECKIEFMQDTNWLEQHKPGFAQMIFGNKLCICPSWLPRPANIDYIIELDPGLAFGTGTHATTALCLEWLATNDIQGKQIIDYGCGSGILGIAAARLGASIVHAVDIDPQALQATHSNAGINQLESLIQTYLPDQFPGQPADILIANILLNPLITLAPSFSKMLTGGERIVLSGVLSTQTDQCLRTYTPWFDMDTPVFRDEWVMLTGTRKRVVTGSAT